MTTSPSAQVPPPPYSRHATRRTAASTSRLQVALAIMAVLLGAALLVTYRASGGAATPVAPGSPTAIAVAAVQQAAQQTTPPGPTTDTTPAMAVAPPATAAPRTPTPTLPPAPTVPTVPTVPTATAIPTVRPNSTVPITRLVIPSIAVDAAIEVRSVDADGVMQDPSTPAIVAWYDFSSHPVDDGNVVFAGHLDYAGYGPAVFWNLDTLQPGAWIEVYQEDGVLVTYAVTSVRPFAATDDASALVTSLGRPTITLITCGGDFDRAARAYLNRLVVTGDRID